MVGRVTTLSRGTPSKDMIPRNSIRTVCSIGEASRKSSRCEAQNSPSDSIVNLKEVMFGKAKRIKGLEPFKCSWNACRFMVLLKRGSEEGVITSAALIWRV